MVTLVSVTFPPITSTAPPKSAARLALSVTLVSVVAPLLVAIPLPPETEPMVSGLAVLLKRKPAPAPASGR